VNGLRYHLQNEQPGKRRQAIQLHGSRWTHTQAQRTQEQCAMMLAAVINMGHPME
jgi:hypothetical protein